MTHIFAQNKVHVAAICDLGCIQLGSKSLIPDSQSTIHSKHIYLIATLYTYKRCAYLIVINSIAVCLCLLI